MLQKAEETQVVKLCECGCGNPAPVIQRNCAKRGYKKGEFHRFIVGHHGRVYLPGKKSLNWKGGKTKSKGRILIYFPKHNRANPNGYVPLVFLVAEKVLGKSLPINSVIHHYSKRDDKKIVICENQAFHMFLHQRERAHRACGNVHWRKCWICKEYDSPENLVIANRGYPVTHQSCKKEYQRKYHARKREGYNGE